MEYPLIIDGERAGSLTAQEEGLYIVFTARTKARGELTRLWLHGAGEEKYLGIMSPAGEEQRLERRISKRALGALRQRVCYASDRSEEESVCAEEESVPMPGEEKAEESGGAEREPDEAEREADETPSREDEEDGLIWYRTEGGALTAFDGKRRLTALPVRLRHGNERVELRTIEGREYMIFS